MSLTIVCIDCGKTETSRTWEPMLNVSAAVFDSDRHSALCLSCLSERAMVWDDWYQEYMLAVYPFSEPMSEHDTD